MKRIAIVMLNWQQPNMSIDLVRQFKNIDTRNIFYHIFLIDNHSPDSSYQTFIKKFNKNKQVTVLQTPRNLGFTGGVNFGLKQAIEQKYDYALVINNDVKIDKGFLKNLLRPFIKNNHLAITGPKIYFAKGCEYHKDRYKKRQLGKIIWSVGGVIDWQNIYGSNKGINQVDCGQYDKVDTDIDFLSGCCLLLDLEKIKKVGLFNNNYFMYLEDADLCQLVKQAGYTIAYIPSSIIWHYNAASSRAGGHLQQYFLSRNRLLFASRFASRRTRFALFRQSVNMCLFGKYPWQKKGVVDFYLRKLNKGSWQ